MDDGDGTGECPSIARTDEYEEEEESNAVQPQESSSSLDNNRNNHDNNSIIDNNNMNPTSNHNVVDQNEAISTQEDRHNVASHSSRIDGMDQEGMSTRSQSRSAPMKMTAVDGFESPLLAKTTPDDQSASSANTTTTTPPSSTTEKHVHGGDDLRGTDERCQGGGCGPPARLRLKHPSPISYMTFGWMTPYMWQLYKRGVKSVQHLAIREAEEAEPNSIRLEQIWRQEVDEKGPEKAFFGGVVFSSIKGRLLVGLLSNIIASFLVLANPILIIHPFLEFLSQDKESVTNNMSRGIMFVALLAVTVFFRGVAGGFSWMVHFEAATHIRSGSLSLIYKKILRLKSLGDKTVGDLVNLQSMDGVRLWDGVILVPQLIAALIIMLVCCAYCLVLMGPWALMAWLVMFGFYPIAFRLAKATMDYRSQSVKYTDKRVGFLTEVLSAIEVTKMFVWEKVFQQRISEIRQKEQGVLVKSVFIQSINMGSSMMVPLFSSCFTFVGYILTGNNLTAAQAFTFVSLLNTIQFSQAVVPFGLKALSEYSVSCQRYKDILVMDEMEPPSSEVKDHSSAVEIQDGSFSWPRKDVRDLATDAKSNGVNQDEENKRDIEEEKKLTQPEDDDLVTPALQNLNVTLKKGNLIGLCGRIGSGKSSLLNAILGRMDMTDGAIAVSASVAYMPQQPWILNDSLKSNILFGETYDAERYRQVVKACALTPDFKSMPSGDETMAGEHGSALSGGQKQRIALARAAYSRSEILLLDDPLSAVDVHVAAHIFQLCICNFLRGQTVVFVTHNLQLLKECDQILVMQDSTIIEQGSHQELVAKRGTYSNLLQSFPSEEKSRKTEGKEEINSNFKEFKEYSERKEHPDIQRDVKSQSCTAMQDDNGNLKSFCEMDESNPIEDEEIAASSINRPVIHNYILSMGGYFIMVLVFITFTFPVIVISGAGWYLAYWLQQGGGNASIKINNETMPSDRMVDNPDLDTYIYIYCSFLPLLFITVFIRSLSLTKTCLSAAKSIHKDALTNIFQRPMTFFYFTPLGRIINRFSADLDEVDNHLPMYIEIFLGNVLQVIAAVALISYTSLWFLLAAVPLGITFVYLLVIFHTGVQQLKSLDSTSLSPVLNHTGVSIHGISTIYAHNKSHHFAAKHSKLVDASGVAKFLHAASNRWLAVRLDFLTSIIVFVAGMLIILTFEHLNASLAGMALSYVVQMCGLFQFTARLFVEAEARFTAVERLQQYSINKNSALKQIEDEPPDEWPRYGAITFSRVNLRYRPGLPLALKDVSLQIKANERVGIVGRTGAGKSSLSTVLFRLMDVESGSIHIDDMDICKFDVEDVRQRISVIPQDATLFTGTIRYNLDPHQSYSDVDLWEALRNCHATDMVKELDLQLDTQVSESGNNFSLGEKQLLCFARAFLRKNKIFILDEAMASMDNETKARFQQTLDTAFADCTQLIIAHRLSTIMKCDRILFMENGQVIEFDSPSKLLSNPTSNFKSMVEVSDGEVLISNVQERKTDTLQLEV